MFLLLQLDWFVDPRPAALPIWLIALGLEAMFIGSVWQVTREVPGFSSLSPVERLVGVCGLGLGYFFITLSVLSTAYGVYAGFLYILFRAVEGVAALHIFYRIYDFVRGEGLESDLTKRVKHLLLTFFIMALSIYLLLKVLVVGPVLGGIWYDISVIYTVSVATLSFLAVRWRYRHISSELNSGIVFGLALCIAGAQIFGFSLTGDVLLMFAGSVVYSAGFWGSAYALWGNALFKNNMSRKSRCENCQGTVPASSNANYCPHCGATL